jgi:hypothetical protein
VGAQRCNHCRWLLSGLLNAVEGKPPPSCGEGSVAGAGATLEGSLHGARPLGATLMVSGIAYIWSNSMTGRTSMVPRTASGMCAASPTASSRLSHLTR